MATQKSWVQRCLTPKVDLPGRLVLGVSGLCWLLVLGLTLASAGSLAADDSAPSATDEGAALVARLKALRPDSLPSTIRLATQPTSSRRMIS